MVSNYPLDGIVIIVINVSGFAGLAPPSSLPTGPYFFNSNSTEEAMINEGVNHPTQINED